MSRTWNKTVGDALAFAVRYDMNRGRAARPAVVESTPELERELLYLLGRFAGGATLARVFGRNCLSWGNHDAPTWALLAVVRLHADGLVETDPAHPAKYTLTAAGRARLGRYHGA